MGIGFRVEGLGFRVGVRWENGKENGNYYSIMGSI